MQHRQRNSIRTDQGFVHRDELLDNPGRHSAFEGGWGRFCNRDPCRQPSTCNFLHRRADPTLSAVAHRHHQPSRGRGGHAASQPAARWLGLGPTRTNTSAARLSQLDEELIEVYKETRVLDNSVAECLKRGLDLQVTSSAFLTALAYALDPGVRPPVGVNIVPLIQSCGDWIASLPLHDLFEVSKKPTYRVKLQLVKVFYSTVARLAGGVARNYGRLIEQTRILISAPVDEPPAGVQDVTVTRLLKLCEDYEKDLMGQQRLKAATANRQYEVTDYEPVDMAKITFDIFPTARDFADNRTRQEIMLRCPTIVVDAKIPNEARLLHYHALFTNYREDYIASLRNVVKLVRHCVPPHTKLDPHTGKLPKISVRQSTNKQTNIERSGCT